MTYTVTATKNGEARDAVAHGPATALEAIDDFAKLGFRLQAIHDDQGHQVEPMELLRQLWPMAAKPIANILVP